MVKIKCLVFSLLLGLFFCLNVHSQTNEEAYQGFQFNFYPPGARSMAMGGAFIGLADDATAAYSNPAGMLILSKPELSVVGRLGQYVTKRASNPDVFTTGELTDFVQDFTGGPTFISFVLPLEDICLSVFFANYIMYEEDFSYYARPAVESLGINRPAKGFFDLVGSYFSVSFALKLTDFLYIGTSINYNWFILETSTVYLGINQNDYYDMSQPPAYEFYSNVREGKIGYTVGILLMPVSKFSIGAVYSYNPEYDYVQTEWEPSRDGGQNTGEDINLKFDIPDRLGVGISYRPIDELVIVADVVYIMYEQLTEKVVSTWSYASGIERGDDITELFNTPNVTEIHFGAEYAFTGGTNPIFLRAGIFTIPDHRIRFIGTDPQWKNTPMLWNLNDYSNDIQDPDLGITLGAGIKIGSSFQVDLAFLGSDVYSQFTLSLVYQL